MTKPAHCEMPGSRCREPVTKRARFTNVFGQEMEIGLCAKHAEIYADPEVRDGIVGRAMRSWAATGAVLTPQEMLVHPAQQALFAHQETCEQCEGVRDWISEQTTRGRIRTAEDVNRIGEYVVANCCELGVQLNFEVGKAMRGLG